MTAQQLLNEHRMVLINSDTHFGHEILCTALAKQNALISIEMAKLYATPRRVEQLEKIKLEIEKL
jgi:hypothetical protein